MNDENDIEGVNALSPQEVKETFESLKEIGYIKLKKPNKILYKQLKERYDSLNLSDSDDVSEVNPLPAPSPEDNEAKFLLRAVCEKLYRKITDGDHRRMFLDVKEKEVSSVVQVEDALMDMMSVLKDAGEKAYVLEIIREIRGNEDKL